MSTPGWYPDPGGRPGGYRYWDGHAWTSQVTGQPGGPGGQAPIGSGGPAPQPPARRSGRGWLIGLIAGNSPEYVQPARQAMEGLRVS